MASSLIYAFIIFQTVIAHINVQIFPLKGLPQPHIPKPPPSTIPIESRNSGDTDSEDAPLQRATANKKQ